MLVSMPCLSVVRDSQIVTTRTTLSPGDTTSPSTPPQGPLGARVTRPSILEGRLHVSGGASSGLHHSPDIPLPRSVTGTVPDHFPTYLTVTLGFVQRLTEVTGTGTGDFGNALRSLHWREAALFKRPQLEGGLSQRLSPRRRPSLFVAPQVHGFWWVLGQVWPTSRVR